MFALLVFSLDSPDGCWRVHAPIALECYKRTSVQAPLEGPLNSSRKFCAAFVFLCQIFHQNKRLAANGFHRGLNHTTKRESTQPLHVQGSQWAAAAMSFNLLSAQRSPIRCRRSTSLVSCSTLCSVQARTTKQTHHCHTNLLRARFTVGSRSH